MSTAFDAIAPRYDIVSDVMTLGLGDRWRRAAAEAADVSACSHVLDAFTGTGDLALTLADRVTSMGEVIGVDDSRAMIDRARMKAAATHRQVRFEVADVRDLPFEDDRFDVVTASGGLRFVEDPSPALAEMVRVTRTGGRIVILEITPPRYLRGLHHRVLGATMPAVGGALGGDREAFRQLADSVATVPDPVTVAQVMSAAGITDIRWREMAGGVATLHHGVVA